jgi:hypothetical protein
MDVYLYFFFRGPAAKKEVQNNQLFWETPSEWGLGNAFPNPHSDILPCDKRELHRMIQLPLMIR